MKKKKREERRLGLLLLGWGDGESVVAILMELHHSLFPEREVDDGCLN